MMSKTEQSLGRGKNLQEFIGSALMRMALPDGHKEILVIGYFSLALEHHHSISLLVTQKNFGSAFALLRSQIEIVFRFHWALKCATQNQIDQMYTDDKFRFPRFGQMSACIDTALKTGWFFQIWKKNIWGPLNSHTHSGLLALGRRFSDHSVEPNYGEGEIFEAVRCSNASLLLLGKSFFTHFNQADDAKTIESFLEPESSLEPQ